MAMDLISEEPAILLVEDDPVLLMTLTEFLREEGFSVDTSHSCRQAIDILNKKTFNVILVDRKLPDGDGTEILEYILKKKWKTKTILITAYGLTSKLKEYLQKGAFDFVEKPFNMDTLLKRIQNASRMAQLEHFKEMVNSYQIIGESAEIKRIRETIKYVAHLEIPILIEGETGTGKELVARNIHLESDRRDQKFISVNCASIPENLFEAEFFGYKKGAFTGASIEKPGLFEMADGGVLHLDEIGEMPVGFQAKLLRVLEQGTFFKVGGTRERKVNVRVIASTNKRLIEEVEKKNFRRDLYYRLAVFNIWLPPLRERKEDIVPIARYFWYSFNLKLGQSIKPFPFPLEELKQYSWKGNVRELKNFLEKELIYLNIGYESESQPLPKPESEEAEKKVMTLEEYNKQYILEILALFDYNKTKTARALDISLSTLRRKFSSWNIPAKKSIPR